MKRYVIEAANDFIKQVENNDLMKMDIKENKLSKLNAIRNNYICGLCSELEALRALIEA